MGYPIPTSDTASFALTSALDATIGDFAARESYGSVPGVSDVWTLWRDIRENANIGDFSTMWYVAVRSSSGTKWWAGKTTDSRAPALGWIDSETGEQLAAPVASSSAAKPWYDEYAPFIAFAALALIILLLGVGIGHSAKR